ncbi:small ribosomal subunit protein uS10m [Mixophyes fleayi]|uniref:small ribosomal subunit protein uS10m n=1 Tax=Mixophyes fleayi TaxID=3061075 RepID=UPI003F4E0367
MSAYRGFALLCRGVFEVSRCQVPRRRPFPFYACAVTQYRQVNTEHTLSTQPSEPHPNDIQSRVQKLISSSDEPDILYKKIDVLAKGHDKMVLDSYEYFTVLAAKELGICVEKVYEPRRKIERFTLLKSIHIFKKHRVQYEMRTHYRHLALKHLTGSTADVYLEYIQRNLPEGVALEITKTTVEKLPEHLKKPIWDTLNSEEQRV